MIKDCGDCVFCDVHKLDSDPCYSCKDDDKWEPKGSALRKENRRLTDELHAVRDELATAHEEIILSRQSEGDTMADLLATREERDNLRAELGRLRSAPVAVEVPEPWNEDSCRKILSLINQRDEAVRLAESLRIDAAANLLRDVPPSRILKDGEVAIRADVLSAMEGCIATLRADDELIPSKALAHLDALRSKGGES